MEGIANTHREAHRQAAFAITLTGANGKAFGQARGHLDGFGIRADDMGRV